VKVEGKRLLVVATVDDPAIPGDDDAALIIADYAPGAVMERIVFKEGDVPPGLSEPIAGFGAGAHAVALDDAGQVLCIVELAGPAERSSAVYHGETLIAVEGAPSPAPGRSWASFEAVGATVATRPTVRATLSGDPASSAIIATWNDFLSPARWEIVAQTGGPVPGVAGATFTRLGPVGVDRFGIATWYGAWAGGEAIFHDGKAIVVAGETVVGGRLVTGIGGEPESFSVSAGGMAVAVTLDGVAEAIIWSRDRSVGICWIADCDCSSTLDFFDFLCYQNAFASGHPYADCDENGRLDIFDFLCFQNSFSC
jgi:hypothetical protein